METNLDFDEHRRLLGLSPGATPGDVRKSYRREMRSWHPDIVGGDGERAQRLNAARDALLSGMGQRIASSTAPHPATPAAVPVPSPAMRRPTAVRRAPSRLQVPPAPRCSARRGGVSCGVVFLLVIIAYLFLLAIGIIGFLSTTVAPWASAILGR